MTRGVDEWGNPLTNRAALQTARDLMRRAGVPDAMRDARVLLAHVLGIDPARVTLVEHDPIEPEQWRSFEKLCLKRSAREPVARILGYRHFYDRVFKVTPYVLDPRPETEILIEHALSEPFATVLDLGTGSGCIALTLLCENPDATALATDISKWALETAEENAAALGVVDRVAFVESNWFDAVGGQFDLIVSNPPYIDPREIMDLAPEVEQYDPKIALFDTDDGLTAYRRIGGAALAHLTPGGRLIVEIGPTQGADVVTIFENAGLERIEVFPDLDGRDRVVLGRAPAR